MCPSIGLNPCAYRGCRTVYAFSHRFCTLFKQAVTVGQRRIIVHLRQCVKLGLRPFVESAVRFRKTKSCLYAVRIQTISKLHYIYVLRAVCPAIRRIFGIPCNTCHGFKTKFVVILYQINAIAIQFSSAIFDCVQHQRSAGPFYLACWIFKNSLYIAVGSHSRPRKPVVRHKGNGPTVSQCLRGFGADHEAVFICFYGIIKRRSKHLRLCGRIMQICIRAANARQCVRSCSVVV